MKPKNKVYCDNCKWLENASADEIGFGVRCRLYIPKESPLRKNDIGHFIKPTIDNENNNCKYFKPRWIYRIKTIFIGRKNDN